MKDWEEYAACLGVDPAVFFPRGQGRGSYTEARAVCARCDVKAECLRDVLRAENGTGARANYRYGFFGGLTPEERASVHRLKVSA